MKSDTQTVVLDTSRDQLFDFLASPENLPKWAVKFCHSIRKKERDWWLVTGCLGEVPVRYESDRRTGVIDFHIATPHGKAVVPSRVVPAGRGAAYVFTQFQAEWMPDPAFLEQVESLKEELLVLKGLLETKERSPAGKKA